MVASLWESLKEVPKPRQHPWPIKPESLAVQTGPPGDSREHQAENCTIIKTSHLSQQGSRAEPSVRGLLQLGCWLTVRGEGQSRRAQLTGGQRDAPGGALAALRSNGTIPGVSRPSKPDSAASGAALLPLCGDIWRIAWLSQSSSLP